MSGSLGEPWSDNTNAPQIPYRLYLAEKENFAGALLTAVSYGIVIVLFFQCMSALLNPVNSTRGGIQWGLVAQTAVLFSVVTVYTATDLNPQSVSYIDDREFTGIVGISPPGPLGYQSLLDSEAAEIVPLALYQLIQWLADGLLLYRCYVIYGMNCWVIAFPCLMYIASFAVGIVFIYEYSQPDALVRNAVAIYDFGLPYQSISFSLNVILTLMIVIRLVLHSKNIRNAMVTQAGASGLYNTIITMVIESFALYAVIALLYFVTWVVDDSVQFIFNPIIPEVQVIALLLIIRRVADRRALTKESVPSWNIGSMQFKSQGDSSTAGDEVPPNGDSMCSMDVHREASGESGVEAEATTIEEIPS